MELERNTVYYRNKFGELYRVRNNTSDIFIAKENAYKMLNYQPNDIWLDAGGNIGAFAIKACPLVNRVISFEPDVSNYKAMVYNLGLNSIENCTTYNTALLWDKRRKIEFYLNNKTNMASHSLFVKRGRDVVTVKCSYINRIIDKYRINKMKVDVEGCEYELFKAITDRNWKNIEEFVFEYHLNVRGKGAKERLQELYELFKKKGFTIDGRDPKDLGGNWLTVVHCYK